MSADNVLGMLLWLSELIVASFLLSWGAEHLSMRYGARFVGRTLMSVATTLPEIAIVVYAATGGHYGIAVGAGLGSNLLMMTLGLAIMLVIATTRLSHEPLKAVDVSSFKLDKVFLILTSISSAFLFVNGYDYVDGFIFSGLFVAYIALAYREMKREKREDALRAEGINLDQPPASQGKQEGASKRFDRSTLRASLIFAVGTIGVFFGAQPFIESLEGFAIDSGISVVVLAVIIGPIAGEMPEKLSMMILARKGEVGASIAVANVLGSKILNNTLLLAVAVFGAMYHAGFFAQIEPTQILGYQMILVTSVTIIALIPMFRREIDLKVGVFLLSLYAISLLLQFQFPHDYRS